MKSMITSTTTVSRMTTTTKTTMLKITTMSTTATYNILNDMFSFHNFKDSVELTDITKTDNNDRVDNIECRSNHKKLPLKIWEGVKFIGIRWKRINRETYSYKADGLPGLVVWKSYTGCFLQHRKTKMTNNVKHNRKGDFVHRLLMQLKLIGKFWTKLYPIFAPIVNNLS